MQCLLIDDDIPTVNVLNDFVDWDAFGISKITTAHNISDAKLLFEQSIPDIIICDIEMPKGTGLDMIKWVREHKYDCGFIFFTCHESFDFASTAISFNADAYVIKPFDKDKLETSLIKAIDVIKQRRELNEYSKYGQAWLKNRDLVEQGFWRDIMFATIPPRLDVIQSEMRKRDLDLHLEERYLLVITCVSKNDMEIEWNDNTFKYALHNLCSDVWFGTTDHSQIVTYKMEDVFYSALIIPELESIDVVKEKCNKLIKQCRKLFRCTATSYLAEGNAIFQIAEAKIRLEEMDKKNIIYKGKVHDGKEHFIHSYSEPYSLDVALMNTLFIQGERVKIVHLLKKELELLASLNKLDVATIRAIHQDFVQVVYALLYKNNIQAHKLFSDEVAQQLAQSSNGSVFEFMKWANYVTNTTIDFLKLIIASEGVVEKAKRFIQEHYDQDLNREDIAAVVFLTPDYLAKRFKLETGLSVKEYLNEYRVKVAQEMLIHSKESISHIATQTGFDSLSYFSTVFKKVTGDTPNAFRAKYNVLKI